MKKSAARMVTSGEIIALLAARHREDVFVPECKNGASSGINMLLKLDAWVLRRTWAPLTTIGYEVKVSRQDFGGDQKWPQYLGLCHEFYFVCPAGLIRGVDLPPEIGLIWTTVSGDRLQTKRRAERHQVDTEKLNLLLTYVVMARSRIVQNMYAANATRDAEDKLAIIRDIVVSAEARKELAYFVRGHIRKRLAEMEEQCRAVALKEEKVKVFENRLASLGITWDSGKQDWSLDQQVINEIDLLAKQIDGSMLRSMHDLGDRLKNTAMQIERLRGGG